MTNYRWRAVGALFLMLSLLVFAGCGDEEKVEEKAPLVKTQTVGNASLGDAGEFSGTVCGRYETNLAFQVGGRIVARNVQVGSTVRAGDVLMVIDPRDVVQQANQGEAQVAAARAQLELAQTNLARYNQLYKENAVPAATLDQYRTNYEAAFANYQNALAQATQGHNAVGYTNLTAGASGVISSISAEEGQVVSSGQTVMTLVQTRELEVEIHVPENRVAEVTAGAPVRVSFWALGNASMVDGVVREVSPMADAATRTYAVRISLPQPPAGIQLGMTASVRFAGHVEGEAQSDEGTLLPLSAIYQEGALPEVWLVDDENTVHLKAVEIAKFGDNEVLVKGLSATDIVVTAGVHKLRDGQKVRLEAQP